MAMDICPAYCPRCKARIEQGQEFCSSCNQRVGLRARICPSCRSSKIQTLDKYSRETVAGKGQLTRAAAQVCRECGTSW